MKSTEGEMSLSPAPRGAEVAYYQGSVLPLWPEPLLAFMFKNFIFDQYHPRSQQSRFCHQQACSASLADVVNAPALCINQDPIELISIKMSGQFTTHINISLVAGLILAFPICLLGVLVVFPACPL
ncbi:MAG: twin-arginine translocase subunit TatC [Marinilabiliales bacterium]|nr:twin-arginine translocase subunit TatC [Marinilabiliales bacterium]